MDKLSNILKSMDVSALIRQFASKTRNIQLLLLILCALMVNANTLRNGFVYDDHLQIVNNQWITNIRFVPEIFAHNANNVVEESASNYYRPVVRVICMVTYYVFSGLKPWGFHLVNVLFHMGVTFLVFLIASLLVCDVRSNLGKPFLSFPFLSALIFAVHPIHSEVVAWAGGVSEISFTFFCLLSMYFHMRSLQSFDKDHFLSLAFFGVAILCKETTVTLLPLLVVYDYVYRTGEFNIRCNIRRHAPFVLIVGIYVILRLYVLGGIAPLSRHPELNTFEVVINIVPLFSQYIEKLLLPINLNVFHVLHPVHSMTEIRWIFSCIILLLFVVLGFVLFKKNKAAFFGLMIIITPLLPAFYIRGLGENTFAERYIYFPSVGFAIIVGLIFTSQRINKDAFKWPLFMLFVSIFAAYSIGTMYRNMVWHDDVSLWTDSLEKYPENDHAHYNLGYALAGKGDIDEAIKEFQNTITINPNYFKAHYYLGNALAEKGDIDAAIRGYQNAITINPNHFKAQYNLGNALASKGNLDAAFTAIQRALEIKPDSFEAHNNLGIILAERGDLNAAIKEFQEALTINPNFIDARNNLDIALTKKVTQ